jgi:hypothetical protein
VGGGGACPIASTSHCMHPLHSFCPPPPPIHLPPRWYLKLLALAAFVGGLVSGVVNLALVPLVNVELVPAWQQAASRALQRDVGD